MNKKYHILISGGQGVGKAYMVRKLDQLYKIIKTASTGTASVNINGCTIDSLLCLHTKKSCLTYYDGKTKTVKLNNAFLQNYDYLVIDEISM